MIISTKETFEPEDRRMCCHQTVSTGVDNFFSSIVSLMDQETHCLNIYFQPIEHPFFTADEMEKLHG